MENIHLVLLQGYVNHCTLDDINCTSYGHSTDHHINDIMLTGQDKQKLAYHTEGLMEIMCFRGQEINSKKI